MRISQPNDESPSLKAEDLVSGDPLLMQLMKVKAPAITLGLAYSLLFNFIRFLAAWRAGHLHTVGNTTGFFDDPGMYVNLFLGAAVMAYYIWICRGIAAALQGMIENEAIGPPKEKRLEERGEAYSFAEFLSELKSSLSRGVWSAASFLVSAAATFVFLYPGYLSRMRTQDSWSMADPWNLALSIVWALIGFYAVSRLSLFIFLSIRWLNDLFKGFNIYVRPLHPDHAGGLSPLGKFALTLSYIITVLGLVLVITPMTRHYVATGTFGFQWTGDVIAGLIAYALAGPFAFFAPLSVAHHAMKMAKNDLLLQIAQHFEAEYQKIQDMLKGDLSGLNAPLGTLSELRELHNVTSRFPVWPFNVESIARFATSFLSPIALAIISTLVRRIP